MLSKRHPNTTRYLGAPEGWEPDQHGDCAHLAVADLELADVPIMQSIWEPTPEDLDHLMAGGVVVLSIVGREHPPVALTTWTRGGS